MRTETDPLGRTTTYAYDEVGNRTLMINARGQSVTSSYDDDNRRVALLTLGCATGVSPVSERRGHVITLVRAKPLLD